MFSFLFKLCNFFELVDDSCHYLGVGHVFFDMFSITNVSFIQLKYYHGHHYKNTDYKVEAFPMTLVYCWLKTDDLDYACFFLSLLCIDFM